eukprot:CAMPEP_0171292960 /NCGR_PEP_ID=MMETSP0816-20121228/981_1 /TAXON_ID=420281 /ORGANISM="Proboscia inermis, Strain CCAP1064/1" /LENGTH=156 /DNA_ID=CAMNT_0011763221 /DNA_START=54 /DNA_END=523 /DNA_ORIENTATION=-
MAMVPPPLLIRNNTGGSSAVLTAYPRETPALSVQQHALAHRQGNQQQSPEKEGQVERTYHRLHESVVGEDLGNEADMEDAKPAMINPMSIPIERSLLATFYALSDIQRGGRVGAELWKEGLSGFGRSPRGMDSRKKQAQNVLVRGERGFSREGGGG